VKTGSHKTRSFAFFLIELALYAGFVSLYMILVVHFLDIHVKQVFDENKVLYALLAVALIMVQGVFLEMLTRVLLGMFRQKGPYKPRRR
jgi:Flp pilus assembly pilin Flp